MSEQEFVSRRQRLLAQLPANAIAVIPAAQEVVRSNDTEYHFRQNSDFFYLTGFNEPDAFLILSNQAELLTHLGDDDDGAVSSAMFVRPKDESAEIWHGRRLGVDAAPSVLGVDVAYSIDDIEEVLPALLNAHAYLYYQLGANANADTIVQGALHVVNKAPKQSMQAPTSIVDVSGLIHAMRLIKSPAELAIMQQSANISCTAHMNAMQLCEPGVFEYQLEACILHSFAMQGARFAAYNTIVGSGNNACILHYTENADALNSGDLVLIDAGSEFNGYAADITRTFPVNGTFSDAQREIYQLVLDAQLASIDVLVPGNCIGDAMDIAVRIITQGLLDLGILHGDIEACIKREAHKSFFMHGLGHYLGLDVHDVGNYKMPSSTQPNSPMQDAPLKPGIVMTVEPGIYIAENAEAPEQYKGIGVRIEDNIVITDTGNKVLTQKVPKTIADIEALMASRQN